MNADGALWTAREAFVAVAADGEPGDWLAGGVSIDSRTIAPGDLFIALEGPNYDGHDFAADALARGAVAAVLHRRPEALDERAPVLMVKDTLEALRGLGAEARRRTAARVIAVTGSVGKTGTKEALRRVLADQAETSASEDSLNNHWGLPLSLARMPRDAAFGIFEMAMNHPGEIAPLSRLARPHVAVITNVEAVHGAYFDSIEEIADAKAEVFAGIEPGGAAVLNRDNPNFARLAAAAAERGVDTVIDFGRSERARVRLVKSTPGPEGARVQADVDGTRVAFDIRIPGSHWVMNALCVLAAVAAAGGDVAAAAAAIEGVRALDGRGRRHAVALRGGETFELIDESYNANPASMHAAIEVLGRAPAARRLAVLGDMLELGPDSGDIHAALADPLRSHGIDLAFTAGTDMARLWDALPKMMRGGHAATSELLSPMVTAAVRPGDVVSVKGSAGSRMGLIVAALLGMDSRGPGKTGEGASQRLVNGE
ncbi:MAG: UDP-N-acetylmuramoylalanyl-D-glutamyl-2,6-diaminopimelate--D-alanyl-D-alanine ligase [Proteobacteria bacterium]|nr:UDP-N-acetylmuramoylalanyl-D-glutamyl-2,6-diaminopimelate--D-alanyl-D-alanine ligase [Pseudomonadota bacterium]